NGAERVRSASVTPTNTRASRAPRPLPGRGGASQSSASPPRPALRVRIDGRRGRPVMQIGEVNERVISRRGGPREVGVMLGREEELRVRLERERGRERVRAPDRGAEALGLEAAEERAVVRIVIRRVTRLPARV